MTFQGSAHLQDGSDSSNTPLSSVPTNSSQTSASDSSVDSITHRSCDSDFKKPNGYSKSLDMTTLSKRRVHWADLPRPDHLTGAVVYTKPRETEPSNSHLSTYSRSALRLHIQADAHLPSHRYRNSHARRQSRTDPAPDFQEVQWAPEPHPGTRRSVDVYEDETVSPRSSVFVHEQWGIEMNAKVFRERVQPHRTFGMRRPGMTASKPTRSRGSGER